MRAKTRETSRTASALPLAVIGTLALAAANEHAQASEAYPNHPVRLIVPFAAGGPADTLGRLVGRGLAEKWGQQVVIENRAGAAGSIGVELASHAAGDGYTLVIGTVATHAINVSVYPKLPYDPLRDFTPITNIASVANVVIVHPSLPVKSVRDVIALAKAQPGALTYSSAGSGTASHLATELLKSMAHVNITHIPYKSAAPALVDLVAGQVQMSISSLIPSIPLIQAKRVRALAVTSAARSPALPMIPTIAEAGVPGYEALGWTGLFAPASTPGDIVRKISVDAVGVLSDPALKARMLKQGAEIVANSPAQFSAYVASEIDKWKTVVKESGARVE